MDAAGDIFMMKTSRLLHWSVANNADILDCLVTINFCHAPPSFDVQRSSDYISEITRNLTPDNPFLINAKKTISENRAQGSITGIFTYFAAAGGEDGDGGMAMIVNSFSGKKLLCGSWQVAQMQMKESMLQDG